MEGVIETSALGIDDEPRSKVKDCYNRSPCMGPKRESLTHI